MKKRCRFFLIYSCLPVISISINEVKNIYKTNNIIEIDFETFMLLIDEFEKYTKKIKTLLKSI